MALVHFVHGLEGSPQGNKARLLAQHFDTSTPAMDTSDFEACVDLHAKALADRQPDVLVGSSFGGAVVCALIQRGAWTGPTLLLAQAAVRRGLSLDLEADGPIWVVHGQGDTVVDPADSRALVAANVGRAITLIEVDDDHSLHTSTSDGRLVVWVRALASGALTPPEA